MKIKIQLLTICLLLATQFTNLYSANVYILQEDACMDRLVYSQTTNGAVSAQVVYRIKPNPVSYVFLSVNEENQRIQEFLPPQVITCTTGTFDEKFVTAVNNKQDRAYMVIPMENRKYAIAEVTQVAFYQDMGQLTTYVSPDFSFSFNRNRGVVGEDISVGNATAQIYFEGTLQNDCSGFFLFRKISPQAEKPHTDFVLIPEVGISEVRQGLNATDAFNNVSRLEKVNTYLTPEYLRLLCDESQVQPKEKDLTIKGTEQPKEFDQPNNPKAKETVTKISPCGEAGNGFHFVNKGETLYRISKAYEITVSQLKEWNGITSNTIYPCDKLRVVANLNTAKESDQQIVDNRPAVTTPAPYDTYVGVKSVSNTTPGWQTNTIYHIVRPGETVAYIAMKYGYTEDRFRAMNNLGVDEVAKPGQPLLTNPCPPNTNASANTNTRPSDFGNTGMQSSIPGRTDLTTKSPFESNYDFSNDERITPQFYMNSNVPSNTATSTANDFQTRGGGSQSILSTELQQRSGANPNAYSDTTVPQNYETGTYKRATHLMKANETLYDVARMYGITVERLRTLNNLKQSDVVIPYQRLYIN